MHTWPRFHGNVTIAKGWMSRNALNLSLGALLLLLLLAACNDHQSTLAPFGDDAADVRRMTVVLVAGGALIFAATMTLVFVAVRAPEGRLTLRGGMKLVLWLGGIVPTVVLLAVLLYALPAMRPRDAAPSDLRVAVEGEQFWWRLRYAAPGAAPAVAANELRLPAGRTVALELTSADVIHSFWVPGLAGKMDMIPGRTNQLVVRATKPGRYRGVCAEFCGLSHALMAFEVVVMEPAAFDRWLAAQRRPATSTAPGGARLFARYGCGGCHSIRGTGERGTIGPDLTHIASRGTIAAGVLPMTRANLAGFIRNPGATKPGVRMPSFPGMPPRDADAIARYLGGLE